MLFLIIVGIIIFAYYCYKHSNDQKTTSTGGSNQSNELSLKLKNSPYYSKYPTAFQLIMHSNQKTEQKIDFLLESLKMGYELEDGGYYVQKSIEENLPYYCETEEEYDRVKKGGIEIPPMLFFSDKSKPPIYLLDGMQDLAFAYKMGSIIKAHPLKFEFWKNKIIQMAYDGDVQAQAALCSDRGMWRTIFTVEEHTRFSELYANKIKAVANTDPDAALAYGRFFADWLSDESKEYLTYAATQGDSSDAWYYLAKLYDSRISIDPGTGQLRSTPISEEERADLLYNKTQCYLCGAQSEIGVMKGFCQYYAAIMIEDEKPDMARYFYQKAHENGVH